MKTSRGTTSAWRSVHKPVQPQEQNCFMLNIGYVTLDEEVWKMSIEKTYIQGINDIHFVYTYLHGTLYVCKVYNVM